jgi:hypothetical protein
VTALLAALVHGRLLTAVPSAAPAAVADAAARLASGDLAHAAAQLPEVAPAALQLVYQAAFDRLLDGLTIVTLLCALAAFTFLSRVRVEDEPVGTERVDTHTADPRRGGEYRIQRARTGLRRWLTQHRRALGNGAATSASSVSSCRSSARHDRRPLAPEKPVNDTGKASERPLCVTATADCESIRARSIQVSSVELHEQSLGTPRTGPLLTSEAGHQTPFACAGSLAFVSAWSRGRNGSVLSR